jgi:tetratricopeptide (TPR) repeat protein
MKKIFALIFITLKLTTFAQLPITDWDEQAKTNKRLLPKYGHQQKTDEEKKADQEFIQAILIQDSTPKSASDHLILLGFNYLYRSDLKTAMYRFNQAYLLDSTNTDIYWGYGAVYMSLGEYSKAKEQYLEGLSTNPKNTHLLTDYATYFMSQYFILIEMQNNDIIKNVKDQAKNYLDSALTYLNKSYQIDPKDQNTTFKLSTTYYYKDDCDNAWKFYNECKVLGGQPITNDITYTKDLKKKCKRKK